MAYLLNFLAMLKDMFEFVINTSQISYFVLNGHTYCHNWLFKEALNSTVELCLLIQRRLTDTRDACGQSTLLDCISVLQIDEPLSYINTSLFSLCEH